MDQWQLEELAKVVEKLQGEGGQRRPAGRDAAQLLVEPAATVEQAVADCLAEYGPQARVAVIPKGPYVLPCVG